MKKLLLLLTLLLAVSNTAIAVDDISLPGASGYDLVSYFTNNKAVKGSGFHTANHNGQNYLFSSKENKEVFEKSPEKYLPQFGGWCAYGASLGKKFHVDPTIFEVVDDKLYFNLNGEIQKKWNAKKNENIKIAHNTWPKIKDKSAGEL